MRMTAQELAVYVREHCPANVGIFIALVSDKVPEVQMLDARTKDIRETVFHVEECRDLEACVMDALNQAQAEVTA